jgi:MoxR-like ATPase
VNIKEAKEQIEQTAAVYLTKDEYGNYLIPVEKQRPVFMLGAPGIGKTAIMEQIARELGIALVSYSMTHHTRQSALGLPLIRRKVFAGKEYQVTEYTMSEIIASVYEEMEKTGKKEGILFLDEINCVSETLSPSMLQFLQYKVFGTHRVPDGWVVVTAGNPPQFNRSVREFDVVTMDRMKILEIDPDYPAWREYAQNRKIHRAILTYLDIKKDNFYQVETTVDGKSYVTARGWEDLSEMMLQYEKKGYPIDEVLIGQYIRSRRIALDFSQYYELFNKYKTDYQVFDILSGTENREVDRRAEAAPFDERISLTGLLLDAVQSEMTDSVRRERELKSLRTVLKEVKERLLAHENTAGVLTGEAALSPGMVLKACSKKVTSEMEKEEAEESLLPEKKDCFCFVLENLKRYRTLLKMESAQDQEEAFALIKKDYDGQVQEMRQEAARIRGHLDCLFAFISRVFGQGNEMLILTTELTVHSDSVVFIGENGCDAYYENSRNLQLYERQQELLKKLDALDMDKLITEKQAAEAGTEEEKA